MDCIPRIKEIIRLADDFDANQMEQCSLRKMMDSHTPVVDMACDEIDKFQDELISYFKHTGWIS